MLSVLLKRVDLFTGTFREMSPSAKEKCPFNRGYCIKKQLGSDFGVRLKGICAIRGLTVSVDVVHMSYPFSHLMGR